MSLGQSIKNILCIGGYPVFEGELEQVENDFVFDENFVDYQVTINP